MKLSDYQRGWIEAIIDGEGHLYILKLTIRRDYQNVRKGAIRYRVGLRITNTCKELLEKARAIIGSGAVYSANYPSKKRLFPNSKEAYRLEINSLPVISELLRNIQLIAKAKQQELLLEFAKFKPKKCHRTKEFELVLDRYVEQLHSYNKKGVLRQHGCGQKGFIVTASRPGEEATFS